MVEPGRYLIDHSDTNIKTQPCRALLPLTIIRRYVYYTIFICVSIQAQSCHTYKFKHRHRNSIFYNFLAISPLAINFLKSSDQLHMAFRESSEALVWNNLLFSCCVCKCLDKCIDNISASDGQ